ncbi:MAG: hypothetical protein R3C18_27785 [Planctomycetaceae bacterium]
MNQQQLLTSAVRIFGSKVLIRISQSEICSALGLCDQKQMVAQLGLTYEAFRWRIATGMLPKPEITLARRAYYSAEQVVALEKQEAGASNAETPNHGGEL